MLLASAFRDGENYVERYFAQIEELRTHFPVQLRIAEGDSSDGTYAAIESYLQDGDELYKIDHGGPAFGSIDTPIRWRQIAHVWNTLFDKITPDGPLILVEADLIWQPSTMQALVDDLWHYKDCDAVAPLSIVGESRFYDTWGYRGTDGRMFTSDPPYHPSLDLSLEPTEINSAGSCIAMKEHVYRECRFGDTDGIVGFGQSIRDHGFHLFCNPDVRVVHP